VYQRRPNGEKISPIPALAPSFVIATATTRLLPFAGRLLLGGISLRSGLSKVSAYAAITAAISSAGLPFARSASRSR